MAISAFIVSAFLIIGAHSKLLAAAPPTQASTSATHIMSYRTGQHAGYLRLVIDLNGKPRFASSAITATDFLLTLWDAQWPVIKATPDPANIGSADLTVKLLALGIQGRAARFKISSKRPAFIRRAFLLPPTPTSRQFPIDPASGARKPVPQSSHSDGAIRPYVPLKTPPPLWRLVVDIAPIDDSRTNGQRVSFGAASHHPLTSETSRGLTPLPAMHGIGPVVDREPVVGTVGPSARPPMIVTGNSNPWGLVAPPLPPVSDSSVEVSWDRASRILQELRNQAAPVSAPTTKPQLVLPAKYQRNLVPLR